MKIRKLSHFWALFLALFLALLPTSYAQAAEPSPVTAKVSETAKKTPEQLKLERRLDKLEKNLNRVMSEEAEAGHPVQSFLSTNLTIGGFFETGLKGIHEEDLGTQIASDENILGVNFGAEFSSKLRFVSQLLTGLSLPLLNQHNDPRATAIGQTARREFRDLSFGSLITQGYLQYSVSDAFNIQGGMGYVPYGVSFQEFELVLFTRRGGPQMLRSTGLVSPFWQGINVFGRVPVASTAFHYSLYTFSPILNSKSLGVGGRTSWRSQSDDLRIGFSAQTGRRSGTTYYTVGPDFRLRLSSFKLTSEVAKSYGPGSQPWSAYVEPGVEVSEGAILLFFFGDYAENPLNRTGSPTTGLLDPIKKWEYGAGINWLPSSFTRIRAVATFNDYVGSTASTSARSRDYWSTDLSGGVAF